MGVIIGIIIAIIFLTVLYGILSAIIKKWPILIWIVGLGGGLLISIMSYWWLGIIIGFLLIGFLSQAEAFGGKKCAHCGSYDTYLVKKESYFELWGCNKCNGKTIFEIK